MPFLHVLGDVFKDVGKASLKVVPLIPGPIGVIGGAVAGVITAEVSGGTPAEKKAIATIVATPAMPDHANKLQMVSDLIEHVLAILNIVAQFFPAK